MVKVSLRGVTKDFGNIRALNKIDLEIEDGELFFLLGPSGCGKTTTLRIIGGFYKPDQGEVLFNSKNINDVPSYKRNIGMVFQNYALWPHMTCYENIIYGLKVRKVPKDEIERRAEKVLEIVQMSGYELRYPNQLSGGQQQRIALARAIVTEPEVLLLDEPLSNLDAKLRLDTRQEIKRIQRELEITSIYVTHDQDEALSMADRIAVMDKGNIEQIGSPRDIYINPLNSFVAEFIGETNLINGRIINLYNGFATISTSSGNPIDGVIKFKEPYASIGQKIICSIRPEAIHVFDKNEDYKNNFFKTEITNFAYYGVIEHLNLMFGDTELKVLNFNPEDKIRRIGDKIWIYFDPKNVDVFYNEVESSV